MMVGLNVAELNLMASDFIDLHNGPDSNTITMTSETGTPDPVYQGKWVGGPTVNTQTFRAIVVFGASFRIDGGHVRSGLLKRRFSELPDADIALLMPATINLKGLVNVVFQIPGLGNYMPLEKPTEDLTQYGIMYPNGQAMVQWVFAKAKK